MITAKLFCKTLPTETQKKSLEGFVEKKYGEGITLETVVDESISGGFKLVVGSEEYDWTDEGRVRQFRDSIRHIKGGAQDVTTLLKENIKDFELQSQGQEIGSVLTVGDGIATVSGLENATYGEIVVFESGIKGMVQEIDTDYTGCILFGNDDNIYEGSRVFRTKKTAGMPVGMEFLGRVVDALGSPIDAKGEISWEGTRPIERPAPSIIDRSPIDRPMETGILSIDSMFPIGRGQRELIIGDRQTGKTAIAIDTIINQKGKNVICVYVAIGQKASSVAHISHVLNDYGAMEYTVIVNAGAGEADPMQYIAPYSGCALAEYFMEKGHDVLIVYDDLSKHAIAYRALSLLLERSPGREAYPGDVFYLHSRLLERSARLSAKNGGGSMTALPIVETQAGDVSAYIPTNIISITDGQIFLESDLFFEGQRPAVNVGLSVSRVGGAAQTKAMKNAVGTLRLDLAQYREMEIFTRFSSDLDEATRDQLAYGQGLVRLLRQPQYKPMKLHEQVITLITALGGITLGIPVMKILEFREKLLNHFNTEHGYICAEINNTELLTDETRAKILEIARDFRENKYC